ncbi:phosphoglycerate mutase family protein [Mucilaginibacter lacusdianchii]|uniref:phosphoglycerate mutase family protein n=1 Tax=Mucilaginibacter lacusdianchii TaxID=2684211 RepID=UPI00131E521A|nr:phosphoglycerate mutase family protein [Mucilaginibacter sp. JXJ CY 39]
MNVSLSVRRIAVCILIIAMAALCNYGAFAQTTTIWLVRHAEKSTVNTADRDPGLTEAGQQRANTLAKVLKAENIANVYTTPYKRTRNTAAPLIAQLKISPVVYDPNEVGSIATKARQENKGRAALIVGHSNTIIPIIKALGIAVDLNTLQDEDYDMLFKITFTNTSKDSTAVQISISHYGEKHHVTEIPAAYKGGKANY